MKTFRVNCLRARVVLLVLAAVCPLAAQAQLGVSAGSAMKAPVLGAGSVDLGVVPAAQTMSVVLYLAPNAAKQAALEQFLIDVQTPGSASYHQWLTPAAFGARFGAWGDSIAAVKSFAAANGLDASAVSASGLRVTLTGTATQMESALAPAVHAYKSGSTVFYANTAVPAVPAAIASSVVAVGGLSTAPSTHPLAMLADGVSSNADDALGAVSAAVDANAARVLALSSDACVEDFDAATVGAMRLAMEQAVAQGVTVLSQSGCGSHGSAGFPSMLAESVAVAVAPGVDAGTGALTELRPSWQSATGLPSDVFRHEPDVTVSSLAALEQTMEGILAKEPANADGSAARLGNVGSVLYSLASNADVYSHPDGAAAGTWEASTGLGVVSLAALGKAFPAGVSANNVQITITNPGATHGQNITFTATVTNTSGNGALPTPTGTVSFVTNAAGTIGTGTLSGGTYALTTNTLPANASYTVVAQYSGDGNYAAANSVSDSFSVSPEASQVSATAPANTAVGQMIQFTVTDASASGVGTPSGTATVIPQYIAGPPTYSGTLAGTGGTATAVVSVPATAAGYVAFKANCVSADPSFTCFNPINVNANVTKGPTTAALSVSPATFTTGQAVTFTATVTGPGSPYPAPTGNVEFYDYATDLGTGGVNGSGVATLTLSNLDGTVSHSFTATYMGDSNYTYSNATNGGSSGGGSKATTGTLVVTPNPPVTGGTTTLTDTIAYTNSGSTPTGQVTFYEDGAAIGTGSVGGNTASYSTTAISGSGSHAFYAVYAGDANYNGDTSNTVNTNAGTSTTTTTITATPLTVASGGTTTLTATVTPATTIGGQVPSGNVTFTSSLQGVLGVAGLNGSTATLTPTLTTAGIQTITATYSGDTRYSSSTSATGATVTVGPATAIVTTTSPASVSYGSTETIASTVSATTNNGVGPSGTLTYTLYGTVQLSATATMTPTSTTSSTATTTVTAPSPGTYNVQTACTGTNFSCANVNVAQPNFTVVKANTTTTLTSVPAAPVAGQQVTFTATVANANTTASSTATAPSGSVTFYVGGTSVGSEPLVAGVATFSTTLSAGTEGTVTAVYGGDSNYNSSNSAPTTVVVVPVNTTASLSANTTTALAGSVVVLTASISDAPSKDNPSPAAPSGSVTFYDVYNGQTIPLGTVSLTVTGPYLALAQLSTTGFKVGSHSITAVFGSSTNFVGSTSSAVTLSMTDFSVAFTPSTLTLTRGYSGSATLAVTALNGFTGTVSLGCVAPSGTMTSCSFTPTSVSGSGVSQLVITTTQPAVSGAGATHAELKRDAGGVALASLLLVFLLPGVKRRRPVLLMLLVSAMMLASMGCTNLVNPSTGGGGSGPGTPLGTEIFTVTASGTDGKTTVIHDTQFQVTVNQ